MTVRGSVSLLSSAREQTDQRVQSTHSPWLSRGTSVGSGDRGQGATLSMWERRVLGLPGSREGFCPSPRGSAWTQSCPSSRGTLENQARPCWACSPILSSPGKPARVWWCRRCVPAPSPIRHLAHVSLSSTCHPPHGRERLPLLADSPTAGGWDAEGLAEGRGTNGQVAEAGVVSIVCAPSGTQPSRRATGTGNPLGTSARPLASPAPLRPLPFDFSTQERRGL